MKVFLCIASVLAASSAFMGFYEDFSTLDRSKWSVISGDWSVKNGMLKGSTGGGDGLLFYTERAYRDFILECRINVENREGSLVFRAKDKNNLYILVFNPKFSKDSQGSFLVIRRIGGKDTYFAGLELYKKNNEWIKAKIEARGKIIKIYADDNLVISVEDDNFSAGLVGLRIFGDILNGCDAYFDDFKVTPLEK